MAQTVEYTRGTSFTDAQAAAPGTPPSGPALDSEFDRLKIATDSVAQSLDLIQQDDGRLKAASVGYDQIDPAVYTGLKPAEVWITGKNFTVNTAVFYDDGTTLKLYRCLVSHTSTDFTVDLAAANWLFLADFTPPAAVGTVGISGGGTGATTAPQAWINLGGGAAGKFDVVPVTNGGTGVTSISALKSALGVVGASSRTVSADATLTAADAGSLILADTTAGQVTLTLPTVAAMGTTSPPIWFVRVGTGSNILRLDGAGSETIVGGTVFDLQNKWDAAIAWCNGTEWVVAACQYSTTGFTKTLLNKVDAAAWRTQLGLGSVAVATLIDDDSFAAATASNVPSAKSVKAYAGAIVAALGATALGIGQTWQNVLSSRAANTSYQNTTGRPIQVNVQPSTVGAGKNLQVSVDNSTWATVMTSAGTEIYWQTAIVPPGHYYRFTGTPVSWMELR